MIITVVCCSPERIRQKLIRKGGKTIKSIEIRVPEKPKPPPEKPKEAEKPKPPPEKPKEAEKPKPLPEKPKPPPEKPKEAEKPKPPPEKPKEAEKPKPPPEKPKEAEKPKPADPPKADKPVEIIKPPPPAPAPAPAPSQAPLPAPVPVMAVHGYPQFFPVPMYCKPCYEVGYGGPCQHGYGTGIPYQPPSSYDGYVKLVTSYSETPAATTVGVGVGWPSSGCRCNRSYACRCEYFTEENPACTIM